MFREHTLMTGLSNELPLQVHWSQYRQGSQSGDYAPKVLNSHQNDSFWDQNDHTNCHKRQTKIYKWVHYSLCFLCLMFVRRRIAASCDELLARWAVRNTFYLSYTVCLYCTNTCGSDGYGSVVFYSSSVSGNSWIGYNIANSKSNGSFPLLWSSALLNEQIVQEA